MFTKQTLDTVEAECKEMLERIKKFKAENKPYNDKGYYHSGTHLSGSVRRQSLELSYALVQFRKV